MMTVFEKDDRVQHEYLGAGTFIKYIENYNFLSLVKWDKTPPVRYNMGENPTVVITFDLMMMRTRKEDEPIKCNFVDCAYGMGQAGAGRCPGDWNDKNCAKFIDNEEFVRQMEERAE